MRLGKSLHRGEILSLAFFYSMQKSLKVVQEKNQTNRLKIFTRLDLPENDSVE
jgi:hypothetical protein